MTEPLRIDEEGVTYRVLDATLRDGKLIVASTGRVGDVARVPAHRGHRRLYRLRDTADRGADEGTLRRQLAMAEYLPTREPGPKNVDPR